MSTVTYSDIFLMRESVEYFLNDLRGVLDEPDDEVTDHELAELRVMIARLNELLQKLDAWSAIFERGGVEVLH